MKKITFNKERNIGKVLFIVEGSKTEFILLHRIFTSIFDYQYEQLNRMGKYKKPNDKEDSLSSVFVINTEESAIKFVDDQNDYLDQLFLKLINDYRFPVDRAAIFYIFDRDVESNTDVAHIERLLQSLTNSRDNGDNRQGLLLLSYPAIESFVASNFIESSCSWEFKTGKEVKAFLNSEKLNQSRIDQNTFERAVEEMEKSLKHIGVDEYDLDRFGTTNLNIFHFQEKHYADSGKYKLLSLFCIIFLDLGLIEIDEVV